uniref:Uncharacterized protein n=1 Tax=Meloidogyne floridensis TaxID=298350 RepID=A0A915NRW8_9BILA
MFYQILLFIILSLIYSSNSQQCSGKPKYNCKYVCNGIDFLVEGLENSDYGLSLPTSDYQRSRPANGAIRVLCRKSGGMKNFCVCDEDGNCFVPVKNNVPVYAELGPYCDQYAVFGCGTEYMKVAAVSCNGCGVIKKALLNKSCKGYFVPNKLDVQNIKGILPTSRNNNLKVGRVWLAILKLSVHANSIGWYDYNITKNIEFIEVNESISAYKYGKKCFVKPSAKLYDYPITCGIHVANAYKPFLKDCYESEVQK